MATNAVTVLHPRRFLNKYGLLEADNAIGATSLKNQAIGLLHAVQYMKVPLILLNVLVMAVELLFGG